MNQYEITADEPLMRLLRQRFVIEIETEGQPLDTIAFAVTGWKLAAALTTGDQVGEWKDGRRVTISAARAS